MHDILKQFTGREHSPVVQFIKYGICGGIATGVSIAVFYVCALWLMPALSADDLVVCRLALTVEPVSDSIRARNSMINNSVAFVFANMVAYLLNIWWVFKAGRHHWLMELGLFYLVSGVSFVIGTALMGWLIKQFGLQTTVAFGANILTSLLINFVMRKYVIFKG